MRIALSANLAQGLGMVDRYSEWFVRVMAGIGAPANSVNADTLWAWSGAESGVSRMRTNNPLNTTQELRFGPDIDPDFNRVGVEIYPSVSDGITATVETLLNGYYPTIVDHLQRSIPRSQWGDCCAELGKWGTGCGWLFADYGAARGGEEVDMTPEQAQILGDTGGRVLALLHEIMGPPDAAGQIVHPTPFEKLVADVEALKSGGGGNVDTAALLAAIADLKAHPDPSAAAIASRIENALKTA